MLPPKRLISSSSSSSLSSSKRHNSASGNVLLRFLGLSSSSSVSVATTTTTSSVCWLAVVILFMLLSGILANHFWNKHTQPIITLSKISNSRASATTIIPKPKPKATQSSSSSSMTTTTSTSSSHHQHHHHAVVCFGDSLTAGTSGNFREYPYAPHLEKALQDEEHQYIKNVTVSHFGLPGWTTQNMLDKLNGGLKFAIQEATSDDDDGRRPPSLVIILAGTNDLGRFVSSSSGAKTVTENIIALHRACYEMHVPRTLAIAIPPSAFQHYNSQASTLAHAINENLQGYCREQEQQRASFFPFPFNYTRGGENWNVDGLHFSPHGYQMLGESLAPIVASILQELDQETTTTTSNR